MDFEDFLRRYVQHVISEEGTDFTKNMDMWKHQPNDGTSIVFSKEEIDFIKSIKPFNYKD